MLPEFILIRRKLINPLLSFLRVPYFTSPLGLGGSLFLSKLVSNKLLKFCDVRPVLEFYDNFFVCEHLLELFDAIHLPKQVEEVELVVFVFGSLIVAEQEDKKVKLQTLAEAIAL